MVPDATRLGGLEWVRRTNGTLTAAERRRLIGAIAQAQAVNVAGRVKLALGRLPDGASSIDVRDFEPPDSKLAREAEVACAEQSDLIAAHSYRTWMWGMARPGFKRDFIETIRNEARAVPNGRFGLLRRCGMTLAVRMAPFDS